MVYLVIEDYGHFYEDTWTDIIGYSEDILVAEELREQLEQQYEYFKSCFTAIEENYDKLYAELPEDPTDEEDQELYDKLKEFEESLGLKDTSKYEYDHYGAKVVCVPKLD